MSSAVFSKKKRPLLRTYSRRRVEFDEKTSVRQSKRRRLDSHYESDSHGPSSPPSSPGRPSSIAIFSDPISEPTRTPPTSPVRDLSPSKDVSIRLDKTESANITHQFSPLHSAAGNRGPKAPRKIEKKRLKQMQIDLGGSMRQTCRQCGMEYAPSISEDAEWHKRFHSWSIGGVDIPQAVAKRLFGRKLWTETDQEDLKTAGYISCIDSSCGAAEKSKAAEILRVVESDLAAAHIPAHTLWGAVPERTQRKSLETTSALSTKSGQSSASRNHSARFKIFVYVKGRKCIGFLLVERIRQAFKVLPDTLDSDQSKLFNTGSKSSSAITVSSESSPAAIGVSRIWTSSSHRRQKVASNLLEQSRKSFLYAVTVPKESMAFSQPSASGGILARKWFDKSDGWLVYLE
ncbi:MAG: hypothetical protein M1814_004488 [Vezdaea aestivalis]|nr:MAG: hypothetical protein M1814_004488 [Vezdaea aestivalis]